MMQIGRVGQFTVRYSWLIGQLPSDTGHVFSQSILMGASQSRERRCLESETDESPNLFDDDDKPLVEMRWNLALLLPDAANCQKKFTSVVAGYISTVYRRTKEEWGGVAPGNTPVCRKVRRNETISNSFVEDPSSINSKVEAFCRNLVAHDMTQSLLALTESIHKKIPRIDKFGSAFPHFVGPAAGSFVPALEFIKAVCKVLSLDEAVNSEVIKLRRDLLKLVGIGEFSDESQWQDPCVSYVLPEVICKACNHCRDLDLCKDPLLSHDSNGLPVWLCPTCEATYPSADLEAMLIDSVKRRSMALVLQDTKCKKCRQIKADNMSVHCSCAGSYVQLIETKQFAQTVKIFHGIARHFRMSLLEEVVSFILKMNPSYDKVR